MDRNKIIAGIVIVGLAVGVFLITKNKGTTCALTAAGVASIVAGVTHGRGVQEIVGTTVAGVFVPTACTSVVESLIESPEQSVSFDLKLSNGELSDQNVTGTTLLSPPPENPPGSVERIVDCLSWDSAFLFRLCVDGAISPRF